MSNDAVERLARCLSLSDLLSTIAAGYGGYELLEHWKQGEFHHDVVVRVTVTRDLPGPIVVVATNCNGGVKEVLVFDEVPDREALWYARCPDGEFEPVPLPSELGRARTLHWFDPCELLAANARSELRPEHRQRQRGGGWIPR